MSLPSDAYIIPEEPVATSEVERLRHGEAAGDASAARRAPSMTVPTRESRYPGGASPQANVERARAPAPTRPPAAPAPAQAVSTSGSRQLAELASSQLADEALNYRARPSAARPDAAHAERDRGEARASDRNGADLPEPVFRDYGHAGVSPGRLREVRDGPVRDSVVDNGVQPPRHVVPDRSGYPASGAETSYPGPVAVPRFEIEMSAAQRSVQDQPSGRQQARTKAPSWPVEEPSDDAFDDPQEHLSSLLSVSPVLTVRGPVGPSTGSHGSQSAAAPATARGGPVAAARTGLPQLVDQPALPVKSPVPVSSRDAVEAQRIEPLSEGRVNGRVVDGRDDVAWPPRSHSAPPARRQPSAEVVRAVSPRESLAFESKLSDPRSHEVPLMDETVAEVRRGAPIAAPIVTVARASSHVADENTAVPGQREFASHVRAEFGTKVGESRSVDTNAHDVRASVVKVQDVRAQDVRAEDVKVQEVKVQDVKVQDVKVQDVKVHQTDTSDARVLDVEPDDGSGADAKSGVATSSRAEPKPEGAKPHDPRFVERSEPRMEPLRVQTVPTDAAHSPVTRQSASRTAIKEITFAEPMSAPRKSRALVRAAVVILAMAAGAGLTVAVLKGPLKLPLAEIGVADAKRIDEPAVPASRTPAPQVPQRSEASAETKVRTTPTVAKPAAPPVASAAPVVTLIAPAAVPPPSIAPVPAAPVTANVEATAAAPAVVASPPTESQRRARSFLDLGRARLEKGDVAAARSLFQRSADLGDASGAFALAETYDPNQFARLGIVGMRPDAVQARRWYEIAAERGRADAAAAIGRLTR